MHRMHPQNWATAIFFFCGNVWLLCQSVQLYSRNKINMITTWQNKHMSELSLCLVIHLSWIKSKSNSSTFTPSFNVSFFFYNFKKKKKKHKNCKRVPSTSPICSHSGAHISSRAQSPADWHFICLTQQTLRLQLIKTTFIIIYISWQFTFSLIPSWGYSTARYLIWHSHFGFDIFFFSHYIHITAIWGLTLSCYN